MATSASLLLRICLVVIFPFSSRDKIFNWDGALRQTNAGILPGGPVPLASVGWVLEHPLSSTPPCAVTTPGYP